MASSTNDTIKVRFVSGGAYTEGTLKKEDSQYCVYNRYSMRYPYITRQDVAYGFTQDSSRSGIVIIKASSLKADTEDEYPTYNVIDGEKQFYHILFHNMYKDITEGSQGKTIYYTIGDAMETITEDGKPLLEEGDFIGFVHDVKITLPLEISAPFKYLPPNKFFLK